MTSNSCCDYAVDAAACAHVKDMVPLAYFLVDDFRKTQRTRSIDRGRDYKHASKPRYGYIGSPSGGSHCPSVEGQQLLGLPLRHHGLVVVSHLLIT